MDLDLQPVAEADGLDLQPGPVEADGLDLQPAAEPVLKRAIKAAGALFSEEPDTGGIEPLPLHLPVAQNMGELVAQPEVKLQTPDEWGHEQAIKTAMTGLPLGASFKEIEARAQQYVDEVYPSASEPNVHLPTAPTVEQAPPGAIERVAASVGLLPLSTFIGADASAQAYREAYNVAKSVPEFFTSLPGLAAIATGRMLPTVTTAYFTADMMQALAQNLRTTYENWGTMTMPEKVRAFVDAGGNLLLTGSLTHGLVKQAAPRVQVATDWAKGKLAPEGTPVETPLPSGSVAVEPFEGAAARPAVEFPSTDVLPTDYPAGAAAVGVSPEKWARLQPWQQDHVRRLVAKQQTGTLPPAAEVQSPESKVQSPEGPVVPLVTAPAGTAGTTEQQPEDLPRLGEVVPGVPLGEASARDAAEAAARLKTQQDELEAQQKALADELEAKLAKSPGLDVQPVVDRAMPRPSELMDAPSSARLAAVEYHVNQDIIDSGKHPNGKKATPSEIATLQERQGQVIQNFKAALGGLDLRPVETESETGAKNERGNQQLGQRGAGAPGMDVRQSTGLGEANAPIGETTRPPGSEVSAGPPIGGPSEAEAGDGLGGGISGGTGKRAGTGRRASVPGRPAGAAADEGAEGSLPEPGSQPELKGRWQRSAVERQDVQGNQIVGPGMGTVAKWRDAYEFVGKGKATAGDVTALQRAGFVKEDGKWVSPTRETPPPSTKAPGANVAPGATGEDISDAQGPKAPVSLKPEDQNHVLPADQDWIPSGDKAKARANLDAIKLLKQLEAEGRNPTPDEKAVLAKYVGWGGLKELFDEGKAAYREEPPWSDEQKREAVNWERSWGKLYDELHQTLTPEEHAAASRSILNAHYTSREAINGTWAAVKRMGFRGGKALEPAAGVGNFIGLTPEDLRARTQWRAVELDNVSGRILAKLYPQAIVHQAGFQDAKIPLNSQDLVISNFPFDATGPRDKRYPALSLHNYFFARSLDLAKPGGLVAAITSDSTMDGAASRKARELFAEKADLVGAFRLPNSAFKKNAGTEVTTDVLFFRKRDAQMFHGEPFLRTEPMKIARGEPVDVNEYYARHPEMLLGKMTREGTMYRADQPALVPTPGADLKEQIAQAVQNLPEGITGWTEPTAGEASGAEPVRADSGSKLGGLVVKDGQVYRVEGDGTLTKPDWAADTRKNAQGNSYVKVRDQAKGVIGQMLDSNASEAEIAGERVKLNSFYDAYRAKYGAINERRSGFLDDDVDFPLALALEDRDTRLVEGPGGKARRVTEWTKSKLFTERTIFPRVAPERVDTVPDGLQVSLNFLGRVDPEYIGRLTGRAPEEVKAGLAQSGEAFENPASGQWEQRSKYLSGFVKEKLRQAQAAAESDPRYRANVAALAKVQPAPIPIENIGVRLGSVWVPPEYIERFLRDRLGVDSKVSYTEQTGDWHVTPLAGQWAEKNKLAGIHDWRGDELAEQSLNLKGAEVRRTWTENGEERSERDGPKTAEAQEKQAQLQRQFTDWAKSTPDVANGLEQIYNETFNGAVAPKFEAPTWAHYPGAAEDITLRDHQKAVVSRILQNSTLLAHAVGMGKTYTIITAAMEQRRLGLAKKPMMVAQNATLEQFARSFKRLYPTARILVPNERARDAQMRQKTMARIATGDWDAVIVPQSFVNMLPDDPVRQANYIQDRLDKLQEALIEAKHDAGKRSPKAADLQRAINKLQDRLDNLADRKQDNVLTFEQLGVDSLFVDEAHEYKKLEFSTKMDSIKGLDTGASQQGFSMMMKARWVQEHNQGRNVTFATGTPVSNTIAEAWNMMRYVRPDVLKAYHIENFDDFASTFGDTITQLEMTAGGTWKPVTRFARYTNGPELLAAWREVADVVTPEEINLPGLPALKNGKTTAVTIPQTARVHNYVLHLRDMLAKFDAMSGRDKRENSHIPLVVFGLAKKATLDMRMIDPSLPDEPGSKLNRAADEVARIYRDGTSVKGAQMVFSDSYQNNPDHPTFNLYDEMKRKLVDRGIPEREIAILNDKAKGAGREALFQKLNDGDIRVAMGSTKRLGTGVNAQEHLLGLHHLDAPARPMDIEQREGRILRQGNSNPEVEVLSYGVENTLDAAMFQKLATKQKFINQILRGDQQGRSFEDAANEVSLSFEEQMAAFSGDKRAMEKVALESQVRQLEGLRSGHYEQVRKARERAADLPARIIPQLQKEAAQAQARAESYQQAFAPERDFTLASGGKTFDGRKAIAEHLDGLFQDGVSAAIKEAPERKTFGLSYTKPLGQVELNGKPISLEAMVPLDEKGAAAPERASVQWKFPDGRYPHQVSTGQGFFHSLKSELEDLTTGAPERARRNLAGEQRNFREVAGFVQQPFEREGELQQARERLTALDSELRAEGTTPTPTASGGEVEHSMAGTTRGVGNRQAPMVNSRGAKALTSAVTTKPANAVMQDINRFRSMVAPQTMADPARFAGDLLRQLNARAANEMARADNVLRPFRDDFDRTPVPKKWKYDPTLPLPRNLAFIDAYEGGNAAALAPGEAKVAAEFRRMNDEYVDRVHALGTGALQTLVQNYFPHIWDDPRKAKQVIAAALAKSPLEGAKSFLRQRTHQLFVDGLAAGLKPVHDNPVDLFLLKKREVERYILAHQFIGTMKEAGLMKFVHSFSRAEDGWSTVKDGAFEVNGPPTVTIKEAFDAGMRQKTLEVLNHLGVPFARRAKLGGKRWGYETDQPGVPGSERITTKFAGPDEVIWHELGHALDNRYRDMQPTLMGPETERRQVAALQMRKAPIPAALEQTAKLGTELRALADLRYEEQTPSPSFQRNVRSTPEKMATVLQAYLHAPERMRAVAPTVYDAFKRFIASHPELEEINEIRPGLRVGQGETQLPLGGFVKLGHWYMPDAAARVVDNYLSPGFNPHLWYRTLRETSHLMNAAQLGLSAFHLGFTSVDAAVSRLAAGIEDISHGDLGRAVWTANPVSLIAAPVTNIRLGARVRAEVLKPGTGTADIQAIARALEAGGGRIGQDAFWQTQYARRMARAFHEGTATGYVKGAVQAPFALVEQLMRPIMEYVVPRQKLGVFADLARRELERLGPNATDADTRAAMRKAWDSVDNRMGQVVYDNLFYQRSVKDLALLAFRAYGWQLGKYRELGGAAFDVVQQARALGRGQRPEMTHRMAYALALPVLVGGLGALTQYLMTGKGPDDWKDYFMPRTGEVDDKGREVRVNLPSYMKDLVSMVKHPLTTVEHALNPLLSTISDMLHNRDFYNTRIYSPNDPMVQRLRDTGMFLGKEFTPFSVSGALKLAEDAAPLHKQIMPFFGIVPAPQRNVMSPTENYFAEQMAAQMPSGAMPRERFDRAKLLREIVRDIKAGRQPEALVKFQDGLSRGLLNAASMETMIGRLKYSPLQFQASHLDSETGMRGWRMASPVEREQLLPVVASKIVNSKSVPVEQKQAWLSELQAGERN